MIEDFERDPREHTTWRDYRFFDSYAGETRLPNGGNKSRFGGGAE